MYYKFGFISYMRICKIFQDSPIAEGPVKVMQRLKIAHSFLPSSLNLIHYHFKAYEELLKILVSSSCHEIFG